MTATDGAPLPRLALRIGRPAAYSHQPALCRLVTSLASGADQIAVAALPAEWEIEVVLPFPGDVCQKFAPDRSAPTMLWPPSTPHLR